MSEFHINFGSTVTPKYLTSLLRRTNCMHSDTTVLNFPQIITIQSLIYLCISKPCSLSKLRSSTTKDDIIPHWGQPVTDVMVNSCIQKDPDDGENVIKGLCVIHLTI